MYITQLNSTSTKRYQGFVDLKVNNKDKTWSTVSNSSFIFVLNYEFWLVLVEGNKINSLSKLKNVRKFRIYSLMESSPFF